MKTFVALLFLIGANSTEQILLLSSLLVAVLICLILSAFYSGSETALVSLNKIRINQLVDSKNPKAKIVHRLVKSPNRMLALTLVGTNLANILIAQCGYQLTKEIIPKNQNLHELIATIWVTTLLLIFGEILPKTIFRTNADKLALRYAFLLRLSEWILAPIIYLIQTLTQALIRFVDKGTSTPSPDAQREELRLLATMGEQSGNLLTDQRRMIHSLLNLQDRTVEQVMVPLIDIVAIEKNTNREDFLQIAADSGFSRIPVYEEHIYNIIGIVNLLDVIYNDIKTETNPDQSKKLDTPTTTIEPFVRTEPHFVPESKNINALLKEIQNTQHTMVFAVNEHGGTVGLVTVEDLIGEIFGEFADERDTPTPVHLIAPHILECDAKTEPDWLTEHYGLQIPQGDYETIAGYILDRVGAIPKIGTELNIGNAIITVIDADTRAVRKIRIRKRTGRFTS